MDFCVDQRGNTYNLGTFTGTVDFDPSASVQYKTSNGDKDFYISKLDSNGQLIWVHTFGSVEVDEAYSITLDDFGNLYSTAYFSESLDFDPSANSFVLPADSGGHSAFILKLDTTGNFIWAKSFQPSSSFIFTPSGSVVGYKLLIDNSNNIIIKGALQGQIDFDPGPGIYNLSNGQGVFPFICKLDKNGNLIWAKLIPASGAHSGQQLAIDMNNNIYFGGNFSGGGDFDPGPGIYTLSNINGDGFLEKLDSNGVFNWAFRIGGASSQDIVQSIVIQSNGSIIVAGMFGPVVDFDPGPGVYNLVAKSGWVDGFIANYSANGNFNWVKQIGSSLNFLVYDLTLNSNDDIFVCGTFDSISDFDPSATYYNLNSNGSWDAYLAKYNSSGNFIWAKSWGGTNSDNASTVHIIGNDDIYIHGSYQSHLADFNPSAGVYLLDSIDKINIYLSRIKDCTLPHTAITYSDCDSFTLGSTTYLNTYSYTDLFNSTSGCDSNVVTTINIESSNQHPVYVSSCSTISFGGQNYTSSGTYYRTFMSANGCDSNVVLTININPITATAQISDTVLTTPALAGASYQWFSCNPFALIPNATQQSYQPTTSGNYGVIVSNNACSDTSSCVGFINTGVVDIRKVLFQVYPNPSTGIFHIRANDPFQNASLRVSNTLGQLLLQKNNIYDNHSEIDLGDFSNGLYILEIKEGDKISRVKMVKQ